MCKNKSVIPLLTGLLLGLLLGGPAVRAAEQLAAVRSSQPVYLDNQPITLEAYLIGGSNYVKLRDIGQAADFNVYWDGTAVQIESGKLYTGLPPEEGGSTQDKTVTLPADGTQYVPKAGDQITCPDGTVYTVTDVSRWGNNMFSAGALTPLPAPTCDWTSFPEAELPAPEARHFAQESGDHLYLRNLYETRRMWYTLLNLAGTNPETSRDGRLLYGSKGTPKVRIQLAIPEGKTPYTFWPWRESELENFFNSAPAGTYSVEAWDVYKDGVFQRTEYNFTVQ